MLFNLKFDACQLSCELNKVDPNEYSYIVFIKDIKQYITNENENVQLYPDENIKVKANKEGKYIINTNKDMMFVFKQYQKVGNKIFRCILNLY